jgi:hypothetical protein
LPFDAISSGGKRAAKQRNAPSVGKLFLVRARRSEEVAVGVGKRKNKSREREEVASPIPSPPLLWGGGRRSWAATWDRLHHHDPAVSAPYGVMVPHFASWGNDSRCQAIVDPAGIGGS